jgi:hypothetical protein
MKNKQQLLAIALAVLSIALIIFILIPDWRKQSGKDLLKPLPPQDSQNFEPVSGEVFFQADVRAEREEFLKDNISNLSSEKEVLGGKFYITNISWVDADKALVEYEDGHIALKAEVIFARGLEVASFSILKNEESEIKKTEARIFSPEQNTLITSPLSVKGEAPGAWFFEATLRLRLVDDKGDIIANSWAQADGEWMTENYVPYEGVLNFNTEAESGELWVLNDNPSGLPEYEVFVKIPVRFK